MILLLHINKYFNKNYYLYDLLTLRGFFHVFQLSLKYICFSSGAIN